MLGAIFIILFIGGLLLAYASTKPSAFRVTRKAAIKAPAEKIFPLINDFAAWNQWSPYEKLDSAMDKNFSPNTVGKGAVYEWEGDNKAGAGQMEITDSVFPSRIEIDLDIIKPLEAHNIIEFKFEAVGGSTNVTWSMFGRRNLMTKFIGIFVNTDRIAGEQFEEGLENLRAIVETK
jgi:uncharacterized protein YndB with AHSA1/START domain